MTGYISEEVLDSVRASTETIRAAALGLRRKKKKKGHSISIFIYVSFYPSIIYESISFLLDGRGKENFLLLFSKTKNCFFIFESPFESHCLIRFFQMN